MSDLDPAIYAARLAAENVRGELDRSKVQHGTLLEYAQTPDTAFPMARIHLDGDPATEIRTVPVIIGIPPLPGDRVSVLYDPPQGAYVFGSVSAQGRGACVPHEVIFSYPGEIAAATWPPWQSNVDRTMTGAKLLLGTAGTTTTTVSFASTTLDLLTGETQADADPLEIPFIADITLLVPAVTSAGDGAMDLTLICYFVCGFVEAPVEGDQEA